MRERTREFLRTIEASEESVAAIHEGYADFPQHAYDVVINCVGAGTLKKLQGEALETTQATPARLAVFDAPLDAESITSQMRENLDDELTEVKSENAIDRITSQANPRTLERVPAGARFKTRLVMDVLCEEDAPLFLRVLEGLRLLEDDALGGGGSRGSGRVSFSNLRLVWRGRILRVRGAGEESATGRDRRRHSGRRQRIRVFVSARGVMNPGLVVKLRPAGPWRIGSRFGRAQPGGHRLS